MSALDWGVIGSYLVCALGLGLYMGRRGSRNIMLTFTALGTAPGWRHSL